MGNPITTNLTVLNTPTSIGGQERRVKVKLWRNLAESYSRINLLRVLIKEGIGLNEIEVFKMGLKSKFKSKKFKNEAASLASQEGKVVNQAMKYKLADEQCYYRELLDHKKKARREIERKLVKNSRPFRKFMEYLNQEEHRRKLQVTNKFKKKVNHLKNKYNSDKKADKMVPEDITEFSECTIYDKNKFENLSSDSYEVKIIGDVELSGQELQVLKLHPKFCIVEKLQEITFEHEQEVALAKLRMEFRKHEENQELTQEEVENSEELEARCRQVFNPETQEYDARRRRVTDLQECSRITLPKPLKAEDEAKLELRKTTQMGIFKKFLAENTNKNNDQKSNLTRQEQEGLKSLQKRIKEGDIIILKTDKSSKFTVTNRQEYLKMGEEHVNKDKIVNRQELIETEETINGHSRAWAHIWGSGKDHKHFERILNSKVTHSENVANLYLMHKDHKPGVKTRPTATGHSSNSLGLSNSVAEILESVANSEPRRYNTISSEDMLSRMHSYNKKITEKDKNKNTAPEITSKQQANCSPKKPMASQGVHEPWDPPPKSETPLKMPLATQGVPEPWDPPQEQEQEYSVIGSDVKALYPSIESELTGKIIRTRVEKSSIEFNGFNIKKGLAYISMNTHLTTNLDEIKHLLPTRISGRKTQLKMSAIKNDWDPESRFSYSGEEYTPLEIRKIQARVIEIATRALFENHLYKFGTQVYKQLSGGSIGDRWTGAASEIVMQDWAEQYENILTRSEVEVLLLAGYVDDGRQGTTVLKPGMKFSPDDKKFVYCQDTELEDKTRKLAGETTNQRMARHCQVAMNSINPNLEFTVECEDDFADKKLPTLDFKIWQDKKGRINHTYYQKEMKTPFLIMARSAAPLQQKHQVLSNELTRRLLNINRQENKQEEYNRVVDEFTKEAKNSEYNHQTTLEIVNSGIKAWKARQERRKDQGQEIYRPASSTLKDRTRKKLLARENWYKNQDNKTHLPELDKNQAHGLPGGPRALGTQNPKDKNITEDKKTIKAIMFVPFTTNGRLAKLLRDNEEKLESMTGTRLKIIERTGVKIQDMLTKSNPWQGQDCLRQNCLLCNSKTRTGKATSQECMKRNIVYETTCATCEKMQLEELENSELGEEEIKDKKRKLVLYKYIGESSRSAYERGWEHINDLTRLSPKSHMLKHVLSQHPGQDILSIEFNMKVHKYCKTSFERQVLESVTIQHERNKHELMNSKSEYNRCSLPRLSTKMGETEYKEYNQSLEQEKLEEEALEKQIRNLRKTQNKTRLHPTKESGPKPKRRKIENEKYVSIEDIWGKPEKTKQEKSKISSDDNPKPSKTPKMAEKSPQKLTIPKFPPPPPKKQEISQLLSKQEQFKMERLEIQQEKEKAWALRRLCHKFLIENDKNWEKRKLEKIEEQERIERKEKQAILSRNAKIRHIEKKIEIGMQKIPEKDRKEILTQEKKETAQIKQDLWKLRNKEKKLVETPETRKIKNMTRKLENLTEILNREKKVQEEQEKEKKLKITKRKEKEKLAKQKAQKWEMLKWINNYIEEKQDTWDDIDLIRTQEKYESEKSTRIEIIKSKKRKYENQDEPNQHIDNNVKRSNTETVEITEIPEITPKKKYWENWRKQITPEKNAENNTEKKITENCETEITQIQEIPKMKFKLKQPTLLDLNKVQEKKETSETPKNTEKPKEETKPEPEASRKPAPKIDKEKPVKKVESTKKKATPEKYKKGPVLKKATLVMKQPIPETKTTNNTKITTFFMPETSLKITSVSKPPPDKTNKTPISQKPTNKVQEKIAKIEKKLQQEKKSQEEKKVIKQSQGFWIKFAEKQRNKKSETKVRNLAPDMAGSQQVNCNPATTDNPSGDGQDRCSLPEHSNQFKSENKIALDAQLGLDRGYK